MAVGQPKDQQPIIPEQPAALTTDGGVVVLQGPFEGVTADFAIGPNGSAAWIRLGGRVYPRSRANRMHSVAETARSKGRQDAAAAVTEASGKETSARDRYHEAEREALTRLNSAKP